MQANAYHRARNFLSRPSDPVIARILGTIQSLLIVALLGVLGLFVALMASRGEARVPASLVNKLPVWVESHRSGEDRGFVLFDDTGIFPLIPDSIESTNPVHRYGAYAIRWPDSRPAHVEEQPGRAGDAAGGRTDPAGSHRDLRGVATGGQRPGGHRGGDDAPSTDPSPDVPPGPVVAAHRGGRAGDQSVDPRGQRHPRRRLLGPRHHAPRPRPGRRLARGRPAGLAHPHGLPGLGGPAGLDDGAGDGARCAIGVGRLDARRLGPVMPAARGPRAAPHGPGLQRGGIRPPAVRRAPRALPAGRQPSARRERPPQSQHDPALRGRPGRHAGPAGLQRGLQQADRHRHDDHAAGRAHGPGLSHHGADPAPESDPASQPVGGRDLRVPRAEARAAPGRPRPFPRAAQGSDGAGARLAGEPVRTGPARRRLRRDPGRGADGDPGLPGRLEARTGLPHPPLDRPQVGPCAGRRQRPPRGDPRVHPRAGRHGPPGRPHLQRLGDGEHRPGRSRATPCPASSRPPR